MKPDNVIVLDFGKAQSTGTPVCFKYGGDTLFTHTLLIGYDKKQLTKLIGNMMCGKYTTELIVISHHDLTVADNTYALHKYVTHDGDKVLKLLDRTIRHIKSTCGILVEEKCKTVYEYNRTHETELPIMILLLDNEESDGGNFYFRMTEPEIKDRLDALLRLGKAAGVHVILNVDYNGYTAMYQYHKDLFQVISKSNNKDMFMIKDNVSDSYECVDID